MTWVESTADGIRLRVRVVPNASKTEVSGLHGEALKIRIQTPPTDGRANRELTKFLSGRLAIPKSRISILQGAKSRDKLIGIFGVDSDAVRAILHD